MITGKHTSEGQEIKHLKEVIELRDKEIKDIKMSIADVLQNIRDINESNDYNAPEVKKRKISELCTTTQYELLEDIINEDLENEKNRTTNTDQSNK